jgi:hypothetical protein
MEFYVLAFCPAMIGMLFYLSLIFFDEFRQWWKYYKHKKIFSLSVLVYLGALVYSVIWHGSNP